MQIRSVYVAIIIVVLTGCAAAGKESVELPDEAAAKRPTYLEVGDWRLFDSREALKANEALPGLEPVRLTGGLETPHAIVNGESTNVSFVFDGQGLEYAQVWFYKGAQVDAAAKAFSRVIEYFEGNLGGASIHGINVDGELTPNVIEMLVDQLRERISGGLAAANAESEEEMSFLLTLDLIPDVQPIENRLHGTLVYSEQYGTFYVFLFEDRPNAPDRTSQAMISLIEPDE